MPATATQLDRTHPALLQHWLPPQTCKHTPIYHPGAAAPASSATVSIAPRHPAPPVDLVAALSAKAGAGLSKSSRKRPRASTTSEAAAASPGASAPPPPPYQLSRITYVLPPMRGVASGSASAASSPVGCLHPDNPTLASYDLVAVTPCDVEGLRAIVANANAVDIVALDLSGGRPPVPLRPDVLAPALAAGLYFEVAYAPAIRDATARRFLIANTAALLRATRGAGVLLTSGAATALELRRPADAAALASLAGLSEGASRAALSSAAAAVLARAERRKGGRPAGAAAGDKAALAPPPPPPVVLIHGTLSGTTSNGVGGGAGGKGGSDVPPTNWGGKPSARGWKDLPRPPPALGGGQLRQR